MVTASDFATPKQGSLPNDASATEIVQEERPTQEAAMASEFGEWHALLYE